jgi:hypothetical protein
VHTSESCFVEGRQRYYELCHWKWLGFAYIAAQVFGSAFKESMWLSGGRLKAHCGHASSSRAIPVCVRERRDCARP